MKFEHLVEINDLLNPLIDTLTREQLWRGLVMRAEAPQDFVMALDECHIVERNADEMVRELRFGSLLIRDRVRFEGGTHVHYRTESPAEHAGALLTMSIEEPQPAQLFVRFRYDHAGADTGDAAGSFYDEFRRSAYVEADIDTIRTIRRYAGEGRLDGPPASS